MRVFVWLLVCVLTGVGLGCAAVAGTLMVAEIFLAAAGVLAFWLLTTLAARLGWPLVLGVLAALVYWIL